MFKRSEDVMEKYMVCRVCEYAGRPKIKIHGSFLIELVLWVCFIVPGLVYSLWRLTTREPVCRECGSGLLIPVDSSAIRSDREYHWRRARVEDARDPLAEYIDHWMGWVKGIMKR